VGLWLSAYIEIKRHDETEVVVRRSVEIDSPFPRWAWQDGRKIEDNEENLQSLLEKYKHIYDALSSEDLEETKKIYAIAAQEYATAYHHDDPEAGHHIMNTGGKFGNSEWKLGDIYTLVKKDMQFQLDIYGNGRLARLLNHRGEEAIIVYLNKEARMTSRQKFGFYKNKDGEWVMVR
jgi:hypothetical protein